MGYHYSSVIILTIIIRCVMGKLPSPPSLSMAEEIELTVSRAGELKNRS